MKPYQLVISPIARDDLTDISQYSTQQWGATQTERYLLSLKENIWSLKQSPLIPKAIGVAARRQRSSAP
jgi:toxin ParE1/3/4